MPPKRSNSFRLQPPTQKQVFRKAYREPLCFFKISSVEPAEDTSSRIEPVQNRERWLRFLFSVVFAAALLAPGANLALQNSGRERDAWQHPQEVMDQIGVHTGSVVADVGCGAGYFTFLLAARVGRQGRVYAVDVDEERVNEVRQRARREGLTQVGAVSGASDDPHLRAGSIDVVLVVDAFHEMRQYDPMLTAIFRALKPGGLLALIDGTAQPGEPRSEYYARHRMPEQIERGDAERNGFRFLRKPNGFTRPSDGKQYYFLIFEKPMSGS